MTTKEAEHHLQSGGRLISSKRLDEVYYNSLTKQYILEFYIGNQLSGETTNFMWEFLPTFEIKR